MKKTRWLMSMAAAMLLVLALACSAISPIAGLSLFEGSAAIIVLGIGLLVAAGLRLQKWEQEVMLLAEGEWNFLATLLFIALAALLLLGIFGGK